MKYGWEICDEVQRFVGNAAETQFVSKAEYDKLMKEVEHYRNDAIARLEAGETVNAYCANPGSSATIKGFIP